MNLKQQFFSEYDEFVYGNNPMSKAFQKMSTTYENSPWHRESSVLVHTNMVLEKYKEFAPDTWEHVDYLGALACAFHDIAKPPCEIVKQSAERGTYRAYHGHELVSARMFEDYVMSGYLPSTLSTYDLVSTYDLFSVAWMIEHHLPWELKDKAKREAFARTVKCIGLETFINVLRADQYGRISDDEHAKKARVETWVTEFRELCDRLYEAPTSSIVDEHRPILRMPIACSGSGKSTFFNTIVGGQGTTLPRMYQKFSLDDLRHEFYDPVDYRNAYHMSVKDKQFSSKANQRFMQLIKAGVDLYVDNTNCSRKARTFYLTEARKRGYYLVADLFPIALKTVIERQRTRTDKTVPEEAVTRQYMSLQLPMIGEFDHIVT